jgi:hypothetical protein
MFGIAAREIGFDKGVRPKLYKPIEQGVENPRRLPGSGVVRLL